MSGVNCLFPEVQTRTTPSAAWKSRKAQSPGKHTYSPTVSWYVLFSQLFSTLSDDILQTTIWQLVPKLGAVETLLLKEGAIGTEISQTMNRADALILFKAACLSLSRIEIKSGLQCSKWKKPTS